MISSSDVRSWMTAAWGDFTDYTLHLGYFTSARVFAGLVLIVVIVTYLAITGVDVQATRGGPRWELRTTRNE